MVMVVVTVSVLVQGMLVPRFVPRRSLSENVFSLARPLWGKPRAEWALCLAEEVGARFPESDGPAASEWASGAPNVAVWP